RDVGGGPAVVGVRTEGQHAAGVVDAEPLVVERAGGVGPARGELEQVARAAGSEGGRPDQLQIDETVRRGGSLLGGGRELDISVDLGGVDLRAAGVDGRHDVVPGGGGDARVGISAGQVATRGDARDVAGGAGGPRSAGRSRSACYAGGSGGAGGSCCAGCT